MRSSRSAVDTHTVNFSVVNGVLLKPLFYPNRDRLIAVDHSSQQMGFKTIRIVARCRHSDFALYARKHGAINRKLHRASN
jgi:hypothetical protein